MLSAKAKYLWLQTRRPSRTVVCGNVIIRPRDTETWQPWLLGLRTASLNPCENDLCKLDIKLINLLVLFIF